MIYLDTAQKALAITLSVPMTTNELTFVSSWESIGTTNTFGSLDGTTKKTNVITVVPSPVAGTKSQLRFLSVTNTDTAPNTVTVLLLSGVNKEVASGYNQRNIFQAYLGIGYSLVYDYEVGFIVYDSNGCQVDSLSDSIPNGVTATTQPVGDNTELVATDEFVQKIGTPQALVDAAAIVWDISKGRNAKILFTVAVGATRTLTITNPIAGQEYILIAQQAATGGQAITFTGITVKVEGSGSGTVTLSNSNNTIDKLIFYYDGTNFYCDYNKAYT